MDKDSKKGGIDSLGKKLYDSNSDLINRKRTSLYKKTKNVNKDDFIAKPLKEKEKNIKANKKNKINLNVLFVIRSFFFGALGLFVVAIIYSGLTFYKKTIWVSPDNISISVTTEPFADSGKEFDILVSVYNENSTVLDDVYLIIQSPKSVLGGISSIDEERIFLDSIFPGQQRDETLPITVFGQQGTKRQVIAKLQYKIRGSSAVFEKEQITDFTIRTTPVELAINSPDQVVNGQETNISITLSSRTNEELKNIVLSVDYPAGFQFVSSEPLPKKENNYWIFDSLKPNNEITVNLVGIFEGASKEIRNLSFSVGVGGQEISDSPILVNETTKRFSLVLPFLVSDIYLGNSTKSIVSFSQGSNVDGKIYWVNTFSDVLHDAEVVLSLPSSLDIENIKTDGVIRLRDRTITWDKTVVKNFEKVSPGESGWLNFSFKLPSVVNSNDSSSEIYFTSNASGYDSAGFKRETLLADKISVRQSTLAKLNSSIYYTAGPFVNYGPNPPSVETKTSYSVRLSVDNSGNELQDTIVKASLTPYSKWTGNFKVSQGTLEYDQYSKEIIWNVGKVSAGAGYSFQSPEAYFQVETEPPFSFLEKTVPLVNKIKLTGVDSFTRVGISSEPSPLTTATFDQFGIARGGEVVKNP